MLVNPYYSRPGQRGLIAHFKATAEATRLPVMLYNIQPRSAINLETESLLELAEVPNIAAVKEASGNLAQISDVIRQVPPGFRVYSGDDGLTLSILALGGHGLVSVAAHHIGSQLKMMITSFESDPGTARQIHHKITPFIQAIFSAPSPVPIKFVLANQGFDCERVRLPLVELNPTEKDRIASTLNAIPS
jgi:4-hydroxy-tetrahydrodipicolinate synthase